MEKRFISPGQILRILLMFATGVALLGFGFIGMQTLADMKTPPARKKGVANVPEVEVLTAKLEPVTPYLTGFGEAGAVHKVPLAAEIQGKVIETHPRLQNGGIVEKGDILVRVDTTALKLSLKSNMQRLVSLKRNRDLVMNEFRRMERLYSNRKLVPITDVEKAEQAYHTLSDSLSQLEYTISNTRLHVERATIRAPFSGRLKSVSVEKGQYISPGERLLTLVDDSEIEVIVALDSERAERVLSFRADAEKPSRFWFLDLERVPVSVSWSQGSAGTSATGVLDRVIDFDADTRMLKLAVRLTENRQKGHKRFPIVEGMFCQVRIPGRTLQKMVRVPRHAVGYDGTMHVSVNNRLKTVQVKIGWSDDDFTYVASGLNPADQVILTRLSNPLENTRIEPVHRQLLAENRAPGRQP